MLHRYETDYGIHNHDLDNDLTSMPLVRQFQAEDVYYRGILTERMDQYLDAEIFKYFGLSWNDFISRPRVECQLMIDKALMRKQQTSSAAAAVLSQLEGGNQ